MVHVHDDDQVIKEMTGGEGADYCFECIGSVSVMAEAFKSSRTVRTAARSSQHACTNEIGFAKCVFLTLGKEVFF